MRRRILSLFAALALASCGAPLTVTAPQCRPTAVQPSPPVRVTARILGCPNLVAASGDIPGTTLYVLRVRVDISDEQLQRLPAIEMGR